VAQVVVSRAGKVLVDARSPKEYRGESLQPAARNGPWSQPVAAEQETFLSAEQLSELYQA
jgi:3-mercaptopyruvate sulfurtransferase SseA